MIKFAFRIWFKFINTQLKNIYDSITWKTFYFVCNFNNLSIKIKFYRFLELGLKFEGEQVSSNFNVTLNFKIENVKWIEKPGEWRIGKC